jgi:hypothetical protein
MDPLVPQFTSYNFTAYDYLHTDRLTINDREGKDVTTSEKTNKLLDHTTTTCWISASNYVIYAMHPETRQPTTCGVADVTPSGR